MFEIHVAYLHGRIKACFGHSLNLIFDFSLDARTEFPGRLSIGAKTRLDRKPVLHYGMIQAGHLVILPCEAFCKLLQEACELRLSFASKLLAYVCGSRTTARADVDFFLIIGWCEPQAYLAVLR